MLLNDIKFAARTMRRAPMFTAAVVLTVMLAIAANTTIFSVVNSVLIRPLPYRSPNRLVQVAEKNDKLNLPNFGASVLNFLSWREQSQSFEALGAVGFNNFTLTGTGDPEQLSGNLISPALTRLMGIAPLLGRDFTDDEEKPNSPPVAMIGEGLWNRRFGADPAVIGRTVNLNGAPTTIVGIAPAALNLLAGGDVYTPLTIDPSKEIRLNHTIAVYGRLKPGVSAEQAQSEMNIVSTHMGQQFPEIRDWGVRIFTLFDSFVSSELKTGLLALLGSVIFVLLIACANIANLLLARASARQGEMAVRSAIGASRSRLVRQLLVESVMLSIAGGATGFLGAVWAVRIINHSLPPNTLSVPAVEMDGNVLWFALALTITTGLLFGIVPAWRTARVDLNVILRSGGRGSNSRMSVRLRTGLAAAELALATVLLIGAGLFIRSLVNLQGVRLGFAPHGLITFQLSPPAQKYPLATKASQLYRAVLDSLQSLPGVRGAATSSGIPFGAGTYSTHPMLTTGPSVLPPSTLVPIDWRIASPGYFKTMGIPLMQGRDFTDADNTTALPVTIVSQATARKFWGDGDPIGQTLRRSAAPAIAFTVVGVVGDVRSTVLTKESPALYYSLASRVWPLMDVVVRTDSSPESLLPAIRQKVHELDSELALANEKTMDQWLSNSTAQPRMNTVLLGAFAFVALLIASIGIYGVLAYFVSQRTGEIGVRMALGASPRNVLRLIVVEGMKVALIGIGIGLVGSLVLGRAISTLVFGVQVRDPATFISVALTLAIVALAACVIPALRASRVDPMAALREQ
ncbi:MAG TPA: ABC transporter permease [Candidatus Acidoferrales bacterium]|nr:ABC transporter permease [Candidatus Acidoferrales bacterium]